MGLAIGEGPVHSVVNDVADGLVQLVELPTRKTTYFGFARDGTKCTYVGEHVFDCRFRAFVFTEVLFNRPEEWPKLIVFPNSSRTIAVIPAMSGISGGLPSPSVRMAIGQPAPKNRPSGFLPLDRHCCR